MCKISLSMNDLDELKLIENTMYELEIKHKNFNFHLKIFLKDINDKLVIFSNGAIDPAKKLPPVYMRSSWVDDIDASCIFLDDPTTHDNNLKLGWGQGNTDVFVIEEWAKIIQLLLKKFRFKNEDTYFFGSSAGGYMSIYFSILLPNTTAIANNPQTNVLNYLQMYVNKMLMTSYKIKSSVDVPKEIYYKLDLVEAIKHYNNVPKSIYYIQNYLCQNDMDNHFFPFIASLNESDIEPRGLYIINYFRKNIGHNPLPQEVTVRYIHQIINGKLRI